MQISLSNRRSNKGLGFNEKETIPSHYIFNPVFVMGRSQERTRKEKGSPSSEPTFSLPAGKALREVHRIKLWFGRKTSGR